MMCVRLGNGHQPMRPLPPRGPLPEDPALPFLAEALDPEIMARRFVALQADLHGLEHVDISYARYKPAQSCVIQYRLSGLAVDATLHGRVYPRARFESALAKARATHRPLRGQDACVHGLPDLQMVVVAFPHDRAVKGMKLLFDPHKLKRILHRAVSRYDPEHHWVKGTRSRVDLITYKPERRCLVRCNLVVRHRKGGATRHEEIYARIYADNAGRRVFDLLAALRADPRFGPQGAPVPAPLGYDPEHRILFFDRVPGKPITSDETGDGLLRAAGEAGAFLARLHQATPDLPHLLQPERLLDDAHETANRFVGAGLPHAEGILQAVERLRLTRPAHTPTAPVCLHGDFHPGQLLDDGASLHCVDFDEAGVGQPGYDVGYFIAHLRRLLRFGVLDEESESEVVRRFVKGYAGSSGKPLEHEHWVWHRDLSLLRMALTSVKHLEMAWPSAVEFYLGSMSA